MEHHDKKHDKKHVGEERFISAYHSMLLSIIVEEVKGDRGMEQLVT